MQNMSTFQNYDQILEIWDRTFWIVEMFVYKRIGPQAEGFHVLTSELSLSPGPPSKKKKNS